MNAYVLGLLAGDGTRYSDKKGRYMVWIDQHIKNSKMLQKFETIMKNLGFKVFVYRIPGNKIRAQIYSKEVFLKFENLMKNIEKAFDSLSDSEKLDFIAGFFDAEGTITDRLVIYNKNLELLNKIKAFLEKLGIVCYVYKFGKVFGIQIYRKDSIRIFKDKVKSSVKLSLLPG